MRTLKKKSDGEININLGQSGSVNDPLPYPAEEYFTIDPKTKKKILTPEKEKEHADKIKEARRKCIFDQLPKEENPDDYEFVEISDDEYYQLVEEKNRPIIEAKETEKQAAITAIKTKLKLSDTEFEELKKAVK